MEQNYFISTLSIMFSILLTGRISHPFLTSLKATASGGFLKHAYKRSFKPKFLNSKYLSSDKANPSVSGQRKAVGLLGNGRAVEG
jgi:hypothetical protein